MSASRTVVSTGLSPIILKYLLNPILARIVDDSIPIETRLGNTRMHQNAFDFPQGRLLWSPSQQNPVRLIYRLQLATGLQAPALTQRFREDDSPRFVDF